MPLSSGLEDAPVPDGGKLQLRSGEAPVCVREEHVEYAVRLGVVQVPGEEVLVHLLADALERATLPAPWAAQRDDLGRQYFENPVTHECGWRHPLDGALRELAGAGRILLALAPPIRQACVSALHATLNVEMLRELAQWERIILPLGTEPRGYRHRGTGESIWGAEPEEAVLPAFHLKLDTVDRLRDGEYIAQLHGRGIHLFRRSLSGSTTASSPQRFLAVEEEESMALSPSTPGLSPKGLSEAEWLWRMEESMKEVVSHDVGRVLRPVLQYLKAIGTRHEEVGELHRAVEKRLEHQVEAALAQLAKLKEAVRVRFSGVPEEGVYAPAKRWRWAAEPRLSAFREATAAAYLCGCKEARRLHCEPGRSEANLETAKEQLKQAEEKLHRTWQERISLREELLRHRAMELEFQARKRHMDAKLEMVAHFQGRRGHCASVDSASLPERTRTPDRLPHPRRNRTPLSRRSQRPSKESDRCQVRREHGQATLSRPWSTGALLPDGRRRRSAAHSCASSVQSLLAAAPVRDARRGS